MISDVQSVIFTKDKWTKSSSSRFLKSRGYIPIKPMHETIYTYRYRIKEPTYYIGFWSKRDLHNKGVTWVIGYY